LLGRYAEAAEQLRQAAAVYRGIASPDGEGAALKDLGSALLNAERAEEAVDVCRRAATLLHEGGDRLREGVALRDLARALAKTRRPAEARTAAEQAVAVFQAIGDGPSTRWAMRTLREVAPEASAPLPAEDVARARVVAGLFSDVGGGDLADPVVQRATQASLRLCAARIDRLRRTGRLRPAVNVMVRDHVSDFMDVFAVARASGDGHVERGSRFSESPWAEARDPSRQSLCKMALFIAMAESRVAERRIRYYINRFGMMADRFLCAASEYLADALDGNPLPPPSWSAASVPVDAPFANQIVRQLISSAKLPDAQLKQAEQTRALGVLHDADDETLHRSRQAAVFGQILATLGRLQFHSGEFALARDFAADGGGDLADERVHNAAQAALFTVEMGITGSHQSGALDSESNNILALQLAWLSDDLKLASMSLDTAMSTL
jgi:hypothetical protein